MAENNQSIIIDVQVDTGRVANELATVTASIETLKKANKGLQSDFTETSKALSSLGERTDSNAAEFDKLSKSLADNRALFAENTQTIKLMQATQTSLSGQLQSVSVDFNKVGNSLKEQGALLTQLKNNYRSLSEEQRNSEGGKELQKQIDELDKKMKAADATMGDFQRNVGNYPKVVTAAIPGFDKLNVAVGKMGTSIDELATGGTAGFAKIGTSAKALGKAFLTPPIGLIVVVLSAIMLAVQKVSEAFKKNDEAGTALARSLAALQPIGDAISKVFDTVAVVIGKVLEKIASGFQTITGFAERLGLLPKGFTEASKAAQDLVTAQDNLEEAERQYTVNSAERSKEASELRAQAAEKDKYTAQERRDMLQKAIELEEQNMEEEKKIAAEKLRILEEKANKEKKTSDATKNAIAQATAEKIRIETNYNNKKRELSGRMSELNKQITAEEKEEADKRKANWEKYQERLRQMAETQKEIAQELEDALLEIMEEGTDKQVAAVELAYGREIAALEKQLATDKSLTEKAKNDLAQLILVKTQQMENETTKIRKEAAEKAVEEQQKQAQRELAIMQQLEDAKIAAMQEGSAREIEQIQVQGQREIEALQQRMETEKDLTAEELDALGELIVLKRQEIAQQVAEVEQQAQEEQRKLFAEQYQQRQEQDAQEYERKIAKVQGDDVAVAELQYQQRIAEHQQLLAMDEDTKNKLGISQQQYEQMVQESNAQVEKSAKDLAISQANAAASTLQAISGFLNSLMSLSDDAELSEEERIQKEKKMAIANAAIQSGIAIATGTAQAMAVPFPANIAAIISTVAAVISNIAAAKKSIKSADTNFATGGIVPGTSYSGDNVTAHVNSGEMILNKEQQSRLFDIANNGNGGGGIDYNAMAQAMSQAVQTLPAPVLVYSEFEGFVEDNNRRINISAL